jgi:cytochrome P450
MLVEASRSIFAHTFLNIANDSAIRTRAIKAGEYMQTWLATEIANRRDSGQFGDDMMGAMLSQGLLDDEGVRRTLGGMFVGSIDTTATCVAKIVTLAGRDRRLARAMRDDSHDLGRLYGWCNEALRRWPHNPIVLRTAVADATLGGRAVKAGDGVIAWTQAAMQDASAFDDPRRLRPDRDPGLYLHLGGGVHPCSGRPVNAFQIPLLVRGLLRRGMGRVGKIGWAGPFPHRLMVKLEEEPR